MDYQPKIWQDALSNYQEIAPDIRLCSHIQSYWFSYKDSSSSPSRVIPDLCSDLIIRLSLEFDILQIDICGPSTHFFYSTSRQPTIYFGIRYYLGGMYALLDQSFKGLKDQLLDLAIVEKGIATDLVKHLSGNDSFVGLSKSADRYFLERLNRSTIKSISKPIQLFFTGNQRSSNYNEIIAKSTLSERSLQRLFREETGLSPYEVFDVLRFQKVYQELSRRPTIKQLDLVEKYGFFDQSHYSRKLKRMTGLSPQAIQQHVGILQDKC